jgi:hypothetical protein
MIQRIQSVWLLLAALCSVSLFLFDITKTTYLFNNELQSSGVSIFMYTYYIPAIAIFLVVLPTAAIFLYKNRKRQRMVSILAIFMNVLFMVAYTMSLDKFTDLSKYPRQSISYSIVSFLPIFSIIFIILAIRGINKDEKLVKSLDRLR